MIIYAASSCCDSVNGRVENYIVIDKWLNWYTDKEMGKNNENVECHSSLQLFMIGMIEITTGLSVTR